VAVFRGHDAFGICREIAATDAADAGLEVWFCPFTNGPTQDALLALLAACAEAVAPARRRRRAAHWLGAEPVHVRFLAWSRVKSA